nr:minor capsid protein [Kingella kingae]
MVAATDTHPYWQYVAINDKRTRETHRKLHGRVYAADDPVWGSFYPPLDFRCRGSVHPISRERGAKQSITQPKTGKHYR